jgi:hypothetical protein
MVETRAQYRRRMLWEAMEQESLQEDEDPEECTACEDRRESGVYAENDTCKRHRKRDDSPYTVNVTTYKRRKPRV